MPTNKEPYQLLHMKNKKLHRRFKLAAAAIGPSISALTERAISEWLKNNEEEVKKSLAS